MLEPSCGEAAFLVSAAKRLGDLGAVPTRGLLNGVELHDARTGTRPTPRDRLHGSLTVGRREPSTTGPSLASLDLGVARHHDDRPVPLAVELLAFAAQVLHCDIQGCDRVATWRSDPPASEPVYRCEEHRTAATPVPGVGLPPTHDGRHRDDQGQSE